jgi:hypothetical protein
MYSFFWGGGGDCGRVRLFVTNLESDFLEVPLLCGTELDDYRAGIPDRNRAGRQPTSRLVPAHLFIVIYFAEWKQSFILNSLTFKIKYTSVNKTPQFRIYVFKHENSRPLSI